MVRLPAKVRPLYPVLKPVYSHATGLVAPFSRALSRHRAGDAGLPTGVVSTVEEAAEQGGGRVVVARPAETIERPAPPGGPVLRPVYAGLEREDVPRVAVLELPAGRVLGPHRAVVTGRGALVQELTYYFGTTSPRQHPLFLKPFVDPPLEVAGRLGVLATRGDFNYYHFLMDVLPRLDVLRQASGVAEPERWYVPATTAFQRELLDLVGVPAERRIDADRFPHVRAECLVLPAPPSMTVVNPPWVVGYLRSALLDPQLRRRPGHGIYVTRGGAANNRQIVNEAEVIEALRRRGFDVIDPGSMAVSEQMRAFAEATVIVAAHGAALGNLVFASPGATVVELFPAAGVLPDYWKLASGVPGLTYCPLPGAGRLRYRSRPRILVSDIVVDIHALERLLDDVRSRTDRG